MFDAQGAIQRLSRCTWAVCAACAIALTCCGSATNGPVNPWGDAPRLVVLDSDVRDHLMESATHIPKEISFCLLGVNTRRITAVSQLMLAPMTERSDSAVASWTCRNEKDYLGRAHTHPDRVECLFSATDSVFLSRAPDDALHAVVSSTCVRFRFRDGSEVVIK